MGRSSHNAVGANASALMPSVQANRDLQQGQLNRAFIGGK